MDGRERFLAVMHFEPLDRVPRWEEGIRQEVRQQWLTQGLAPEIDLATLFAYDRREEVELDLEPHPYPRHWPCSMKELKGFQRRFQPTAQRFPENYLQRLNAWRARSIPLILCVQRGFFLSMGVEGWDRFLETIALTKDQPELVAALLRLQGELSASLVEQFLQQVSVDAALFSEPIGGNHGPLISPQMYAELVLPSYQPILEVLNRYQVPVVIIRTYANPRPLLPLWIRAGLNCLWAVEAPPEAMDYCRLRREFGKDLRLIGGIDADSLRAGPEAIRRALERVAPLVEEGGYIPMLDGRVRENVRFSDYLYYRQLFEALF